MALIYDLADPTELQGFVRGVQQEQEAARFVLSQFLPNDNIDDIEYRVTTGQLLDEEAATFRAWDTESPIGGRQGVKRLMGELPPLSKKYRVGEEERLRRRALETGSTAGLVAQIYNDAAKGSRAITARMEMARGEALANGSLVINENGVVQTVNFERKASHTVAPAILWTNRATATPVEDENAWLNVYRDTNAIDPGLVLMSNDRVIDLSLNAQYRNFASVQGITPAFLSLNQINLIRAAYSLPPIYRYDVKVRNDAGVQVRVIPANKVIYLPPAGEPLGRTFFGTTAEAIELQEAKQIDGALAPGMISVVDKTSDPVATWTKVAAIGLPVLMNPDLTLVATVAA